MCLTFCRIIWYKVEQNSEYYYSGYMMAWEVSEPHLDHTHAFLVSHKLNR